MRKSLRAYKSPYKPAYGRTFESAAPTFLPRRDLLPGGQAFHDITRSRRGIPTVFSCSQLPAGGPIPGISDYIVMTRNDRGVPGVRPGTDCHCEESVTNHSVRRYAREGQRPCRLLLVDELDGIVSVVRSPALINASAGRGPRAASRPGSIRAVLGIPSSSEVPFDPRDVIARLVDDIDFDEFSALGHRWSRVFPSSRLSIASRHHRAALAKGHKAAPMHPARHQSPPTGLLAEQTVTWRQGFRTAMHLKMAPNDNAVTTAASRSPIPWPPRLRRELRMCGRASTGFVFAGRMQTHDCPAAVGRVLSSCQESAHRWAGVPERPTDLRKCRKQSNANPWRCSDRRVYDTALDPSTSTSLHVLSVIDNHPSPNARLWRVPM